MKGILTEVWETLSPIGLLPEKKGIKASYWQNHRTKAGSEWKK